MAEIKTPREYICNLERGTTEVRLRSQLMQEDENADEFRVTLKKNGSVVPLSGASVTGWLYYPVTKTMIPLAGSVIENYASITLTASCYDYPGNAILIIQVSVGSVRHTVLKAEITIEETCSNRVIDPDATLPSLPELLAEIGNMRTATADAQDAADDARVAAAANETRTNTAIERVNKTLGDALAEVAEAAETAAPAIRERKSGAMAAVPDAAARSALSVLSAIAHVQSGTGDPAPDNVRPIRGWDAVTLDRTGANLLGGMHLAEILRQQAGATIDTSDGTVRFSGANQITSPPLIRHNAFKPGQVYTVILYGRNVNSNYSATNIAVSYSDGSYVPIDFQTMGTDSYAVYHTAVGKTVRRIFAVAAAGETILYYDMCGVFEGVVTAGAMIPSRGMRLSAALPETVYGGTLDWTTGILTEDYISVTLNGTEEYWSDYDAIRGYSLLVPTMKTSNGGTGWCSHLPVTSDFSRYGVVVGLDNKYLYFSQVKQKWGVTTLAELKAYLAANPVQIVIPRSTPYTIQLDPHTLPLLKGVNNVWSDTGDTAVSYVADTKMYIDQQIAAIAAALVDQ